MSRYLVFILGALWGAVLVSFFTENIAFIGFGFVAGVLGSAFVFWMTELADKPHEKFDTKYPRQPNHD